MLPCAVDALLGRARLVGNPAALHASGRRARAVLEDAREELAVALGAHPSEVILTSGGSEADSIALWTGSRRPARRGVLIGATEHAAVAQARTRFDGVEVLGCDRDGLLDPDELARRTSTSTAMVSVMTVNNETGTVQDLAPVVETARRNGAWVHTDAVQAVGTLDFDFAGSGVDLASVSAHKLGGPVGVGALLARRDVDLTAFGLGGGQERGVRSGTQPVMLAASFAAAATDTVAHRSAERARLAGLRRRLVEQLRTTITGCFINGADQTSPAIVNVTFDQTRADDVLMLLDRAGVDCSTGSACHAGVHQPSDVLLAMGRTAEQASASVRFSMGRSTTAAEIDRLCELLPDVVSRARAAHVPGA